MTSIFRHRNARASALTMALSTPRPRRPRCAIGGHHQLPPTALPERQRDVGRDGLPVDRGASFAGSRRRPPAAHHFPHQPGEPIRPQPDLDAVHPHINPLDQKLHDPRLLGGEQLVP